jgi:hypothetical protein
MLDVKAKKLANTRVVKDDNDTRKRHKKKSGGDQFAIT